MTAPEIILLAANGGLPTGNYPDDLKVKYIRRDASPEVVAKMPGAQALVAAAYEAAAACADDHYAKVDMGNPGHWISALTPADAKAALDRLIAEAVAERMTVQAAAKVLLDAWDGTDKDAFHRVVVASSFGAQAFAVVPYPDAKSGAMFRALMQAVINPDDTELDWLRAKNAIRALAEGGRA